jgi:hypothetical protein
LYLRVRQARVKWRALMKTVMNFGVPPKAGNFLIR